MSGNELAAQAVQKFMSRSSSAQWADWKVKLSETAVRHPPQNRRLSFQPASCYHHLIKQTYGKGTHIMNMGLLLISMPFKLSATASDAIS